MLVVRDRVSSMRDSHDLRLKIKTAACMALAATSGVVFGTVGLLWMITSSR